MVSTRSSVRAHLIPPAVPVAALQEFLSDAWDSGKFRGQGGIRGTRRSPKTSINWPVALTGCVSVSARG